MKFIRICFIVCLLMITINSVAANQQMKLLSISNLMKYHMDSFSLSDRRIIQPRKSSQELASNQLNTKPLRLLSLNKRKALENYYNGEWLLKIYSSDGSELLSEYTLLIDRTSISKSGLGICFLRLMDKTKSIQYLSNVGVIGDKGLVLYFDLSFIDGASLVQAILPIGEGNAYLEISRDCTINSNEIEYSCKVKALSEVINFVAPLTFEKLQ